jgi:hypothetical protein
VPTQTQADPTFVTLAVAYQQQTQALRDRLSNYVRSFWKSLGTYRAPQQAQYARDVTPVVLGAQQQMASLTTSFLAHQRQRALGGAWRPAAVDMAKVTGKAARLGTPPNEVHARPFNLVWRQLDELPHEPGSIEKAIESGLNRAEELALDDLQLTKNHTQAEVAKADNRVKYVERLLEGPSSCGLCIVASTMRYHPGKLMPIHGGCDCGQRFVYADEDPGHILHLDRLQNVHDAIEQRFGASDAGARFIPGNNYDTALQYRDILVVHEHGELGPVLGVRGSAFTGPSDLA